MRDVAASESKVFWEAWGVKRPVSNASEGATARLDWGARIRVASRLIGEDFEEDLECIRGTRRLGGQFSMVAATTIVRQL